MKLVLPILILFSLQVFSQEFSFTVKFENPNSQVDSVQIGYDPDATDGIDVNFNESNNTGIFNSSFAVSVINGMGACNQTTSSTQFLSRQITKKGCTNQDQKPLFKIGIKSNSFPVRISWDSTLFNSNTTCIEESFITDWTPGLWFDAMCGPVNVIPTFFNSRSSLLLPRPFEYEVINGDTIRKVFIGLTEDFTTEVSDVSSNDDFLVYPNPNSGSFYYKSAGDELISIFNIIGERVFEGNIAKGQNHLVLTELQPGVYFMHSVLWNKVERIVICK